MTSMMASGVMSREFVDAASRALAERLDEEIIANFKINQPQSIGQQIREFIEMSDERNVAVTEVWLTSAEITELLSDEMLWHKVPPNLEPEALVGQYHGVNIMRKPNG